MPQPGASQAVTSQHQDIPQTSYTKDSCKTIKAISDTLLCPLPLRYSLDGWEICFSTTPFEMQELIHRIAVMLPHKNLHSTQLLHHCKHSDCLKAATFLQRERLH